MLTVGELRKALETVSDFLPVLIFDEYRFVPAKSTGLKRVEAGTYQHGFCEAEPTDPTAIDAFILE